MSRTPLSLHVDDVSSFAKSLRHQLEGATSLPSHVEMLNLLCKAGGYRNFQHFRDRQVHAGALPTARPAPELNLKRIKETLRHFDERGLLLRWPKKHSVRLLALWVIWSRLPARSRLTEPQINELLSAQHGFGDHALLRRWLVDHSMVERTADGSRYLRREVRPPADAEEVIRRSRPDRISE